MATGLSPFRGESSGVIFKAILDGMPTPAVRLNPDLPADLERVISKSLEKDRNLRYQHASEIRSDLMRLKRDLESGKAAMIRGALASSAPKQWRAKALSIAIVVAVASLLFPLYRGLKRVPTAKMPLTQRVLTASPSDNLIRGAAISRDGKYLAYSDDYTGISVEEIDTGKTRLLPGTKGFQLQDWSPDGTNLLAVKDPSPHLLPPHELDLFSVSAQNGGQHKIANQVRRGIFSRDGSQILLVRQDNDLWLMNNEGASLRQLIAPGPHEGIVTAVWSPDGGHAAYIRSATELGGTVSLETCDLQGKQRTIVLSTPALNPFTLWWLPDGQILYTDNDSVLWSIRVDAKDGRSLGNPRRITGAMAEPYVLRATADGRRLVALMYRLPVSIYIADLNADGRVSNEPVRLTRDTWRNIVADWTPDSRALFFSSSRGSPSQIYKQELSQPTPELFGSGPDDYFGGRLTPDGSELLFWARSPNEGNESPTRLARIPLSYGASETVLTATRPAGVRCASANSNRCIMGELGGTEGEGNPRHLTFSAFDPHQGRINVLKKVDVDNQGFFRWDLSPDGSKIVLVTEGTVRVLNLNKQQVQSLVLKPALSDTWCCVRCCVAWSRDGKELFVSGTAKEDKKSGIWRIDMTGNAQLLVPNPPEIEYHAIIPSPDGKHLAYSAEARTYREVIVILMENF
jgi:Tol biopolymer transport system component